jgi:hypothetical protein
LALGWVACSACRPLTLRRGRSDRAFIAAVAFEAPPSSPSCPPPPHLRRGPGRVVVRMLQQKLPGVASRRPLLQLALLV